MTPYDTRIYPPAPFVQVIVENPFGDARPIAMRAMLDTGADITAFPREMINALKLKSAGEIDLLGISGQVGVIPTFVISLEVIGVHIREFNAIEWPGDFVVLGRDVLNEFYIILDGQMRQFEMRAM